MDVTTHLISVVSVVHVQCKHYDFITMQAYVSPL